LSTEAQVLDSGGGRVGPRRWDLRTTRTLRYALGVTTATAIAFAIQWPLFFLTPVLAAVFLALPLPGPTLGQGLRNIGYVFVAFGLGAAFTLFLLPYPMVYVPALGLALFRIYYLANRGGPVMLVVLCILAVLILPMMGTAHDALASGFAFYFVLSGVLAIVIFWLAHRLLPNPPAERPVANARERQRGYSPRAARTALKSTAVILPLAILFIAAGWVSQVLVLVFAAIFSLSPQISHGAQAGLKSLTSTVIGGLGALVFFNLLVAVPEFHFFVLLMFLTALVFGAGIFSNHSYARYLSSAFTAILVLVGGSMGNDPDILGNLITRVALLCLASLYVVCALIALDRLFYRTSRNSP
jgi:hypothetical protein